MVHNFMTAFGKARFVYLGLPEGGPREFKIPETNLKNLKFDPKTTEALNKLEKFVDLGKKEALRKALIQKGASTNAMMAFRESYDPQVAPTIKKIIEDTKPALDTKTPEAWEYIHKTLISPASKTYYSQAYYDLNNPELAPLVPPNREILDFPEKTIVAKPKKGKKPPEKLATL